MSGSREASPDWLREFQGPTQAFVTLSSASDSSPEVSPRRSNHTHDEESTRFQKQEDTIFVDSEKDIPIVKAKKSKTLSKADDPNLKEETTTDAHEEGPADEDLRDKPVVTNASSRLPLLLPDKVQRSKALIECDGDYIDLSGDVGAVGRIMISNSSCEANEMLLDLKGTIYKTTVIPSRTFCIVNVGQSEAKIEAIMNDFIQLQPRSNVFEAETMVEGTLEGFSFDSEEEGDKVTKSSAQGDQNNENGDQDNTKTKRKAEKSSGAVQKAKSAGKLPKKGAKRPQAAKRTKKSKN